MATRSMMFDKIMEFSQDGYYSSIVNESKKAIEDWARVRGQSGEEAEAVREEARMKLEQLCVKTGWREEENKYINMEAEFFSSGKLDEKRAQSFQKELVKQAGKEQYFWTFAATTGSMTLITELAMAKQNRDFEKLLPKELKLARRKANEQKIMQRQQAIDSENSSEINSLPVVKAYFYADGSVSTKYDTEKAKVRFDRLGFRSGIDWKQKYSPNNEVKKIGWTAGFSEDEVTYEGLLTNGPAPDDDESVVRLSRSSQLQEIKFLFVDDAVWIDDSDGVLSEDLMTQYYDVDGNLYGRVGVDKQKSAEKLIEKIQENKAVKIAGIVGRGNAKVYQPLLGDLITSDTEYFDIESGKALMSVVQKVGSRVEVLKCAAALASAGLNHDEITQALNGPRQSSTIELPLALNRVADWDVLLKLSKEESTVDEADSVESNLALLQSLSVPSDKKKQFDQALGNVLAMSKPLKSSSGLSTKALITAVYERVVEGKASGACVGCDVKLSDLISSVGVVEEKKNGVSLKRLQIPEASFVLGAEKINSDVSSDKDFSYDKIPEAARAQVMAFVDESLVGSDDWQKKKALRFALSQYPAIAAGTGMIPLEIVKAFVCADSQSLEALGRKYVHYQRSLDEVIDEAMAVSAQKRLMSVSEITAKFDSKLLKSDLSNGENAVELDRSQVLSSDELFMAVIPLFQDLNEEEADSLKEALGDVKIPETQRSEFVRRVKNEVKNEVKGEVISEKQVKSLGWFSKLFGRLSSEYSKKLSHQNSGSLSASVENVVGESKNSSDLSKGENTVELDRSQVLSSDELFMAVLPLFQNLNEKEAIRDVEIPVAQRGEFVSLDGGNSNNLSRQNSGSLSASFENVVEESKDDVVAVSLGNQDTIHVDDLAVVSTGESILESSFEPELKSALNNMQVSQGQMHAFMAALESGLSQSRSSNSRRDTAWTRQIIQQAYSTASENSKPSSASVAAQKMSLKSNELNLMAAQMFSHPLVRQSGISRFEVDALTRDAGRLASVMEQTVKPVTREVSSHWGADEENRAVYEPKSWNESGAVWASRVSADGMSQEVFPLSEKAGDVPMALQNIFRNIVKNPSKDGVSLQVSAKSSANSAPDVKPEVPRVVVSLPVSSPVEMAYTTGRSFKNASAPVADLGNTLSVKGKMLDQNPAYQEFDLQEREMNLPERDSKHAKIEANYELDKRVLAKSLDGGGAMATSRSGGMKGGQKDVKLFDDVIKEVTSED